MKASETTLRELLEGTKQFQIPLFQRRYSWNKTYWITLWEDLINIYDGGVEGGYFVGTVVTQSTPGTQQSGIGKRARWINTVFLVLSAKKW